MAAALDRRRLLKAGVALGGSLVLNELAAETSGAPQPAANFVRYSVFDPRAPLDAYGRGVAQMKKWSATDANDPRGWVFQAAIHGSTVGGQFFNQCKHSSWWFFSWHRGYLHFFERLIRVASGDFGFALPYWDWNANGRRSIPEAFRDPDSALYDATRLPAVNAGNPLPSLELDLTSVLNAQQFLANGPRPGFGGVSLPRRAKGLMESPPHDTVHDLISGNMGDLDTAASDPIFWVHHANVDRLWDVWLARGRSNPSDDAWLKNVDQGQSKPFIFFDEKGTKVEVTTADFIPGGRLLDYNYDVIEGNQLLLSPAMQRQLAQDERKPLMGKAPPRQAQPKLDEKRKAVFGNAPKVEIIATENRVILGATPVTIQAVVPQAKQPRLMMALELAREDVSPPAVMLHVEGVLSSKPPGVVFRVFLNQKGVSATTDPDETNYVGSIALFQSAKHNQAKPGAHGGAAGETFSFDITSLAQSLKTQKKWDEAKLDVTFVSKGVGGKTQPQGEVSFKRVSVTVESQ